MAKKTIQTKEAKAAEQKAAKATEGKSAAKGESQTTDAKTMPVHPDPDKETILLRYPHDGSVKVASELKQDTKGVPQLTTVEPSLKNQPAFYEKRDSQFIANFFKNMRAQMKDPTMMPEMYIAKFADVPSVADTLHKLSNDPNNDMLIAEAKKYRTYTNNLEKIKFDEVGMPKAQLAAAGFDVKQLEEDGVFKEMEIGNDSSKLYPLRTKLTDDLILDGLYSLHPSKDANGNTKIEIISPLPTPEFELVEDLKMELTNKEKASLYEGNTLERALKHDGEYCLVGFNRDTGRMLYTPCKEIKVPDFLQSARVNDEQKSELSRGGKVRLEKCHYYNNDNNFSCDVQYNVKKRDFVLSEHSFSRPYIPEYIGSQLDNTQRQTLLSYRVLGKQGLKDFYGEPLKSDIFMSRETNSVKSVNSKNREQAISQDPDYFKSSMSESKSAKEEQKEDMQQDYEQGQSVGRGRGL